jgi:uncharacterized protein YjeT (DUF2065 family)
VEVHDLIALLIAVATLITAITGLLALFVRRHVKRIADALTDKSEDE